MSWLRREWGTEIGSVSESASCEVLNTLCEVTEVVLGRLRHKVARGLHLERARRRCDSIAPAEDAWTCLCGGLRGYRDQRGRERFWERGCIERRGCRRGSHYGSCMKMEGGRGVWG